MGHPISVRVHELARQLGVSSATIINHLHLPRVTSAASALNEDDAAEVRKLVAGMSPEELETRRQADRQRNERRLVEDDAEERAARLVDTKMAAAQIGVKPATVRAWVHRGKLKPAVVDSHGTNLFDMLEVARAERSTRDRSQRKVVASQSDAKGLLAAAIYACVATGLTEDIPNMVLLYLSRSEETPEELRLWIAQNLHAKWKKLT